MKRSSKISLSALLFAFVLGGAAFAISQTKKATEVEATHSNPVIYHQGGVEANGDTNQSFSYDLTDGGTWGNFNISTAGNTTTFTVSEKSANQKFHYYSATIRVPVTVPAYSYSTFDFNFTATSTLNGSGGEPDHAIEVYFLGANNGGFSNSDTFTYNKDDYTTASARALFRAGKCAYGSVNGNGSKTNIKIENKTSSQVSSWFIYFHVAGYVESSKNNHTLSASCAATITETSTNFVCYTSEGGYYDDLAYAVAASYSYNGMTITMLRDVTETYTLFGKRPFTLNMNGHSIAFSPANAAGAFFYFREETAGADGNYAISIIGNGTISGSATDSLFVLGDANADYRHYNFRFIFGSGVTVNATGGRAITVHPNASVDVQDGATVRASQNNAIRVLGTGKASIGGTVISTKTHAVYVDSATGSKIGLYGEPTITPASSSYAGIYVDGSTSAATIWAHHGENATIFRGGSKIYIQYSGNVSNGATIVSEIDNTDYSRNNALNYIELKHATLKLGLSGLTTLIATPITYTISFFPGAGTGSMSYVTRDINTAYTIPTATFTAPAYQTFWKWNTNSDGSGTTYYAGNSYTVTANLMLYAFYHQTDENIYDEFRLEYLHMTTYTVESGYCLDGDSHHYFQTASDYFADHMSKAQRLYFYANYTAEWTRFEAWAAANHKTIVLDGEGNYSVETKGALATFKMDNHVNMILIVSGLALIGAGALAYMLIRKKKSVK